MANPEGLVCRLPPIDPPLFSSWSSWSLLFPFSATFHTVLSSCQGSESESPLSAATLFFCPTLPSSGSECSEFGLRTRPLSHTPAWPRASAVSQHEQGMLGGDLRVEGAHVLPRQCLCLFILLIWGKGSCCLEEASPVSIRLPLFLKISKWPCPDSFLDSFLEVPVIAMTLVNCTNNWMKSFTSTDF